MTGLQTKGVTVLFPGNSGSVNCCLTEVARKLSSEELFALDTASACARGGKQRRCRENPAATSRARGTVCLQERHVLDALELELASLSF